MGATAASAQARKRALALYHLCSMLQQPNNPATDNLACAGRNQQLQVKDSHL